ncbi:ABC transporter ATP-binding protein [Lentibacillus saliphilus]|uniref:ABC transporter ATP-binding protein n=1 Tax=Lentibacillus saliphilus TaxID=2737028 RepID=UPI001C30C7FF|nr:ABC transporter ATP-binding protein [Lentibacillus saliphilus]
MIILEHVEKSYSIGTEKVHVLNDVSLEIADNSYVSIVGPSGSGKSTLLHTIGGLEPIDKGKIYVDGAEVHTMKDADSAQLRLNHIGYVFQQFQLLSTATALENVMMPLLTIFRSKEVRDRAEHALERVGLSHRMTHLPSRLSGGEQQRVAIARALVTNPSIILADEPTGNLDSKTGENIIQLLEDIHDTHNVTIVLITHDDEIAARTTRRIRLLDGKIHEDDTEENRFDKTFK